MFSISNNFLESSVDIKTKLESYSYIPKSKIPAMLRVLNLGILPKIDLSVLGIAIFSLSPIFKFISLDSKENFEIKTSEDKPQIVESIPGWAHYIKNIGEEDMIVILWANEIFDEANPDTYSYEVENG